MPVTLKVDSRPQHRPAPQARGGFRPRGWLPVLATVLYSGPVTAQPILDLPAEDSGLKPTFSYQQPVEKNYLRTVIEVQAIIGVGFMYYVTTSAETPNWELNYQWETFKRKITLEGFGTDTNHFGTNFVGHPLGGTGYYLAARSNRLGAFESAAFAFIGSVLWEYFGEIGERVSMNDKIVTPMGGVAIGEATLQLGAFFDRSERSTKNRVLGSVFAPFKSVHDWLDGLELKRESVGYAKGEWHRFELQAGAAVLTRATHASNPPPLIAGANVPLADSQLSGGVSFRFSESLARLPGYAGAGHHRLGFKDGNVSSLELEGIVGNRGLLDLKFAARPMLTGLYFRDADQYGKGDVRGVGGVLGLGTGFEFSVHDYRRRAATTERISTVQPLLVMFRHRGDLGALSVNTFVDVGASFGGLSAHALVNTPESEVLPTVLARHQYYFGIGGLGRSGVGVKWRWLEWKAMLRGEGYEAVKGNSWSGETRIRDARILGRTELGLEAPTSSLQALVGFDQEVRSGIVGNASAETVESTFRLGIGGVF